MIGVEWWADLAGGEQNEHVIPATQETLLSLAANGAHAAEQVLEDYLNNYENWHLVAGDEAMEIALIVGITAPDNFKGIYLVEVRLRPHATTKRKN